MRMCKSYGNSHDQWLEYLLVALLSLDVTLTDRPAQGEPEPDMTSKKRVASIMIL